VLLGPVFNAELLSSDRFIEDDMLTAGEPEVVAVFAAEVGRAPGIKSKGKPAIVRGKYGKGKVRDTSFSSDTITLTCLWSYQVVLISPHPEQTRATESLALKLIESTFRDGGDGEEEE